YAPPPPQAPAAGAARGDWPRRGSPGCSRASRRDPGRAGHRSPRSPAPERPPAGGATTRPRRGARYEIMSILRCEALTRTYPSGGREITVLRDITFELEAGRILAITGPSGSGKSTLLGGGAGRDSS